MRVCTQYFRLTIWQQKNYIGFAFYGVYRTLAGIRIKLRFQTENMFKFPRNCLLGNNLARASSKLGPDLHTLT